MATTNSTSSISNDYYLESINKTRTTGSDSLDKNAFLKILITQLQNQDPTDPMDDRDFIAQMAQFSSLEQMQNVAAAIEKLVTAQTETQLISYSNFVGKEVKWHEILDEQDENGKNIINEGQGIIKEVKFQNGSPVFILEDGKELTAGNISSVINSNSKVEAENPLVTASQLIGKKVQYNQNGNSIEGIIQSISTNNFLIEYILENGDRLTKDQFELLNK